jgi:hypothetical protein
LPSTEYRPCTEFTAHTTATRRSIHR